MSPRLREALRGLLLETAVYAPLVWFYFLLVMRWMGDLLQDLFHLDLRLYAVASLLLMVGQAVLLDGLAGLLLRTVGRRGR